MPGWCFPTTGFPLFSSLCLSTAHWLGCKTLAYGVLAFHSDPTKTHQKYLCITSSTWLNAILVQVGEGTVKPIRKCMGCVIMWDKQHFAEDIFQEDLGS